MTLQILHLFQFLRFPAIRKTASVSFLGWCLIHPALAVSNRSVSGSQQFTVICEDRSMRQNLAGSFDEVRRGLFVELGIQLGAPTPIFVNITPRKIIEYGSNTWNVRWLDAPEGARVQLDVLVDDQFKDQRLQEHVVSALLLTIKYRDKQPAGGETYFEAPAWLVEGLSEKIRQQSQEPDAVLYRGLLNASEVPEISDWLKVDPAKLDGTSLGIYRAYACALVGFFQSEPNGKEKLRQYLQQASSNSKQDLTLLAKLYPNLGEGGKNLAKWWSLSLARLSAADRYASWSGKETENALNRMTTLKLKNATETETFSLEQFDDFIKNPGLKDSLATLNNDLVRLSIRAHPLYRPVITGYQDIVLRLQRKKTKGLSDKLNELTELRVELDQRLESVSDYLTWFEATQDRVGQSEFDGYFKLMQSFEIPRPPSQEPLGRYLDAMEGELRK